MCAESPAVGFCAEWFAADDVQDTDAGGREHHPPHLHTAVDCARRFGRIFYDQVTMPAQGIPQIAAVQSGCTRGRQQRPDRPSWWWRR